jgi:hypothetical protein
LTDRLAYLLGVLAILTVLARPGHPDAGRAPVPDRTARDRE